VSVDLECSDEEVVERVRAGDRPLFAVLMRRYNRRLYRIARAIVGPVQAEDVMQEAYLRSFTHLAQFAGTGPFSTWLTKIALHEALAQAKQNRRLACEPHDLEAADRRSQVPDALASDRQLLGRLEGAVDELPAIYRAVFVLRAIEGLGTDDTASALGVSPEVVKVRLHRARALLRAAMGIDFEDAAGACFPFGGAQCDRVVAAVLARIREPNKSSTAL
jgi:RNA polymerase sigma-70 factor (ECF subfamily)